VLGSRNLADPVFGLDSIALTITSGPLSKPGALVLMSNIANHPPVALVEGNSLSEQLELPDTKGIASTEYTRLPDPRL
jgi:hypothetical protein